jgi:hypothetical protein
METEDDEEVAMRLQEPGAATAKEEISHYHDTQTEVRTRAESQDEEDLHTVWMRRMREQNAAREIGRRAEQASDRAQRPTAEMQQQASSTEEEEIRLYNELQARSRARTEAQRNEHLNDLQTRLTSTMREMKSIAQALGMAQPETHQKASEEPRRRRNRVPEQRASPPPPSDTSSDPSETTRVPEAIPFSSGYITVPSLKRTDTEAFKTSNRPLSPRPNTQWRDPQWRDPQRQRGRLNLDFSRIDTQYILTHEFIDDVNTMLDSINGWPAYQFEDVEYAFREDCDNRGRTVEFVDLGSRKWGVRLLNPLITTRRDSGMLCPFRSSSTPSDRCQTFGGTQGCLNKTLMEERITRLKNFRDQQSMPPPPLLRRSSKRQAIPGPSEVAKPLLHPTMPAATPRPPDSPRPGFRQLPDPGTDAKRLEDKERLDLSLWKKVDQLKTSISQLKNQAQGTQGPQAEGRELVRQFLQKANLTPEPSEQPVRPSPVDNSDSNPISGKLIHNERIPTGPHSLRSEDISFASATVSRKRHPSEPWAKRVHAKPREQYFTAANTIYDESSGEDEFSSPGKPDQSSIDRAIQSTISSTKSKLKFRPLYLKSPRAY